MTARSRLWESSHIYRIRHDGGFSIFFANTVWQHTSWVPGHGSFAALCDHDACFGSVFQKRVGNIFGHECTPPLPASSAILPVSVFLPSGLLLSLKHFGCYATDFARHCRFRPKRAVMRRVVWDAQPPTPQ